MFFLIKNYLYFCRHFFCLARSWNQLFFQGCICRCHVTCLMTFSTSSSTCWHYTNTLQFTGPIKFTFFMCFKWIVIKQFFKFLTFLKINPSIEVEPVSHLSKISASRIWQQTRPNTPRVRHYLSTKMYKVCLLLPEAFHTLFFTWEYYRPRYSLFPRVFFFMFSLHQHRI